MKYAITTSGDPQDVGCAWVSKIKDDESMFCDMCYNHTGDDKWIPIDKENWRDIRSSDSLEFITEEEYYNIVFLAAL